MPSEVVSTTAQTKVISGDPLESAIKLVENAREVAVQAILQCGNPPHIICVLNGLPSDNSIELDAVVYMFLHYNFENLCSSTRGSGGSRANLEKLAFQRLNALEDWNAQLVVLFAFALVLDQAGRDWNSIVERSLERKEQEVVYTAEVLSLWVDFAFRGIPDELLGIDQQITLNTRLEQIWAGVSDASLRDDLRQLIGERLESIAPDLALAYFSEPAVSQKPETGDSGGSLREFGGGQNLTIPTAHLRAQLIATF